MKSDEKEKRRVCKTVITAYINSIDIFFINNPYIQLMKQNRVAKISTTAQCHISAGLCKINFVIKNENSKLCVTCHRVHTTSLRERLK